MRETGSWAARVSRCLASSHADKAWPLSQKISGRIEGPHHVFSDWSPCPRIPEAQEACPSNAFF